MFVRGVSVLIYYFVCPYLFLLCLLFLSPPIGRLIKNKHYANSKASYSSPPFRGSIYLKIKNGCEGGGRGEYVSARRCRGNMVSRLRHILAHFCVNMSQTRSQFPNALLAPAARLKQLYQITLQIILFYFANRASDHPVRNGHSSGIGGAIPHLHKPRRKRRTPAQRRGVHSPHLRRHLHR